MEDTDSSDEIWKLVADNSDLKKKRNKVYVSTLGRVKVVFDRTERIALQHLDNGYAVVHIRYNGKRRLVKVHRLVAEAFCPRPSTNEKLEVNHINEMRNDNRSCNLEWVTHRYNLNYGSRGKMLHNFGNIRWRGHGED